MLRKLNIKYARAKNFICFGPEGIEFNFTDYGNIVLIRGENLDTRADTKKSLDENVYSSSNGTGKSSIQEIIVYGLYGKAIKKSSLSHSDLMNNKAEKGMEVEVRWDQYRVLRKRSSSGGTLQLWECDDDDWDNATEITKGKSMAETQAEIEAKLGLNYESFVNIVVFADNNSSAFLEVKTETKRAIVEDLLALFVYNSYSSQANTIKNQTKANIKTLGVEYNLLLNQHMSCENRILEVKNQETNWKTKKTKEISDINASILDKENQLQKTDAGSLLKKYEDAQEKIQKYENELVDIQTKIAECRDALSEQEKERAFKNAERDECSTALHSYQSDISEIQKQIKRHENSVKQLSEEKNPTCDNCGFAKDNTDQINHFKTEIKKLKEELEPLIAKQDNEKNKLEDLNKDILLKDTFIKSIVGMSKKKNEEESSRRKEISNLSKINKPEVGFAEKLIEEQIFELKRQLENKENELNGPSPYVEIYDSAVKDEKTKKTECEMKKFELDEASEDLPYYEFWSIGYGDKGIRKFIIDDIIPALNARTAHWLQFLIDGKIKITFNDELQETIERNPPDGDPFVYHAMSGGERRRLNLAVSQAFAHIMMLSCGTIPSIVFLDEVTTNIDPVGVIGVYNMIMELSKEKQVFVTTHDHDLLELLSGCEKIKLRKQGGLTTLVKDED